MTTQTERASMRDLIAPLSLSRKQRKKLELRLSRERRKRLTEVAAAVMREAANPFNAEGPLRHGYRSGLCLEGWSWGDADDEAAQIVAIALRWVGARRPTWEEAQPEWWVQLIEHTHCVRCTRRIPDERTGGNKGRGAVLYCSNECAQSAYQQRSHLHMEAVSRGEYLARCAARRETTLSAGIDCDQCREPFQPGYGIMRRRFCSKECADAGKTRRLSNREEIACTACSAPFRPKTPDAKYCSSSCYSDMRARASNGWRGVERQCEICSTIFRVHSAAKPQRTCSRRCGWMLRRREAGSNAAEDTGQSEDPAERRCAA